LQNRTVISTHPKKSNQLHFFQDDSFSATL
jgi:hypothetical protein